MAPIAAPDGDRLRICVSPKADAALAQITGQELKLVYPQAGRRSGLRFEDICCFERFFLQPMDSPARAENDRRRAIAYCLGFHPRWWRLSVQTHKYLGTLIGFARALLAHPMTDAIFEITKAAAFDAAHYLEAGSTDNPLSMPCTGIRFGWRRACAARLDATRDGWRTSADLDAALRAVAGELDHGLLNEKDGSGEADAGKLSVYFAERLKPRFPGLSTGASSELTRRLHESCALSL